MLIVAAIIGLCGSALSIIWTAMGYKSSVFFASYYRIFGKYPVNFFNFSKQFVNAKWKYFFSFIYSNSKLSHYFFLEQEPSLAAGF
ncbi:hypothetical protein A9Q89_01615 [Gammaproteobacteria bacterium 53_120_T64]|nr:hypothetical protein A9Q89_01615 [Gammaproteobacteria bacterium 53_120_T64]